MGKYFTFDKHSFNFKEARNSVWRYLKAGLKVILVSLSFTIMGYGLVALVFSTRTEKVLKESLEQMELDYAVLSEGEQMVGDVITGLQLKDAHIYEQIFQSKSPNVDPVGNLDFLYGSDTIPDRKLVSYTSSKVSELEARALKIDSAFVRIIRAVGSDNFEAPPMVMPLDDVSYPQIGAGTGNKIQPFYKTVVFHNGLDVMALLGAPVYASADGVVSAASRSSKGQGNIIEIKHAGGYLTRYEHLSDIYVSKGQTVRRGRRIATVGMSGQAFVPHLHYEVLRDTLFLNPINYIFASVSPEEYSNMLFMAANTLQSMD